jgi:two-component system sensor histidine kinase AlgZ
MKDSQILSTFLNGLRQLRSGQADSGDLLDTCQVGAVLRAVLLVQVTTGVVSLFWQLSFADWLLRYAILTAGTLPATLVWLTAACALKRWLQHWSPVGQYASGVVLGALAGVYGCAMLAVFGLLGAPWLGSALAGAMLAAVLLAARVLRARGAAPAATTARLGELQARIRPHFLFNTLNSAIALVRAEPARAEAVLEDLSDLFRHALADPGESVSLEQEITLAQRYLAIEQVRFGDRLRVNWALDPAANQARLPPLLLQPLVENAVRHGVEPSPGGADLLISTLRRGDRVVIRVENTVLQPQGPRSRGQGMALTNVRARLSLLHDMRSQFRHGLRGEQYQVLIEVPA